MLPFDKLGSSNKERVEIVLSALSSNSPEMTWAQLEIDITMNIKEISFKAFIVKTIAQLESINETKIKGDLQLQEKRQETVCFIDCIFPVFNDWQPCDIAFGQCIY